MRWLVPTLIILFCGSSVWLTLGFDRMPPILKRGIQPSDFPQLVAGLIVVLTVLMIFRDPVRSVDRIGGRTWVTIALLPTFAVLTMIDFFLALAICAAALAACWGERRPAVLFVLGFAVPAGVFLLFDQVFRIRFPRGLLTNLWYG